MKAIFTCLILIISIISYAQTNSSIEKKIDSLKNVNSEYTALIEKNNILIHKLTDELILSMNIIDSVISIPIITMESVFLRKTPSLFDRNIITIPKGENLTVIGYRSEFFIVKSQNQYGFAYYSNIPLNDDLKRIMEYYTIKEKLETEKNYKELEEKNKQK